MRILWVSDSLLYPGGYGTQTRLFVPRLNAAGHEVAVLGTTHIGEPLHIDGVTMFGGTGHPDACDLINEYARRWDADIVLTLKDPMVYSDATLHGLKYPWVPVVPVDTEPLNIATKNKLAYATMPLALTRHSQRALADEGIHALYTPHGIDTSLFTPGNKAAARARFNLPQDVFVALFVGANQSRPARKGIDQLVLSWVQFTDNPAFGDARLWLHTLLGDDRGGIDVDALLRLSGLSPHNWDVTDQALLASAAVKADVLRDLYRAADVLVIPSRGEGFCLPLVEAAACGCPAIAPDWTAMRETHLAGWRIPHTMPNAETVWHESGGFHLRVSRGAIVHTLRAAAAQRDNAEIAQSARDAAMRYDVDRVIADHWLPALARIEGLLFGADLGVTMLADEAVPA